MTELTQRLSLWLWGARELIRLGRPDVALAFLGGLGDELLCTVPLQAWLDRGARNVWLRSPQPKLFTGFGPCAKILPNDPRYGRLAALLGRPFRYLAYSNYEPALDRDSPPTRHLVVEMCRRASLVGAIRLQPLWHVSATEHAAARPWQNCVAIQTSTLTAHVPMPTKQWPVDRFQQVVDRLTPRFRMVQIGSVGDPPLRNVEDLRGKTSLRQTAALLYVARMFIGLVGFPMHLARAVDCPSVIVYGGRETPRLTGYSCNFNIARTPVCSPCWQRTRCNFSHVCMTDIPASEVLAACEKMIARPRGPLCTDIATL